VNGAGTVEHVALLGHNVMAVGERGEFDVGFVVPLRPAAIGS
jgi:hypothetical protein